MSFCLFTAISAPISTGKVTVLLSFHCDVLTIPSVFSLRCPLSFIQVTSLSFCLFTAMSALIYTGNTNVLLFLLSFHCFVRSHSYRQRQCPSVFSLRCPLSFIQVTPMSFCLFIAMSALIYTGNVNVLLFLLSFHCDVLTIPSVYSLRCPLPFLQITSVSFGLFTAMSALIYTGNANVLLFLLSLHCDIRSNSYR